jgi:hypothetical protein
MAEPIDEIAAHVDQILSACLELPPDRQRKELRAWCQRLFVSGMSSAAVFAIERECVERLGNRRTP